ncbi:MAG: glyoxalase/bleomycin resistance/dioxygenase family protein [Thermoleophilia bacterium]|nr:glyoxalase/bleomycin resistance/dioxygenase family protein [Thermoleophilia bacterium]
MPDLVRGVDFVSLGTEDLARAVAFYRDTLGLELTVDRSPHNAEFDTGTVTLSLLDPVKMGIGTFTANPNPLALHVDDVAAARAELEALGVEFGDPIDTGVCHMGIFQDPDGNSLMLHHRYAPKES